MKKILVVMTVLVSGFIFSDSVIAQNDKEKNKKTEKVSKEENNAKSDKTKRDCYGPITIKNKKGLKQACKEINKETKRNEAIQDLREGDTIDSSSGHKSTSDNTSDKNTNPANTHKKAAKKTKNMDKAGSKERIEATKNATKSKNLSQKNDKRLAPQTQALEEKSEGKNGKWIDKGSVTVKAKSPKEKNDKRLAPQTQALAPQTQAAKETKTKNSKVKRSKNKNKSKASKRSKPKNKSSKRNKRRKKN